MWVDDLAKQSRRPTLARVLTCPAFSLTFQLRLSGVVPSDQVSDGMKREMAPLVEQLGADGIEAKRQVSVLALCDPLDHEARTLPQW